MHKHGVLSYRHQSTHGIASQGHPHTPPPLSAGAARLRQDCGRVGYRRRAPMSESFIAAFLWIVKGPTRSSYPFGFFFSILFFFLLVMMCSRCSIISLILCVASISHYPRCAVRSSLLSSLLNFTQNSHFSGIKLFLDIKSPFKQQYT